MDKINKAFYEMIKNMWKALKLYNKGDTDAVSALRKIHQQLESLINSIKYNRSK